MDHNEQRRRWRDRPLDGEQQADFESRMRVAEALFGADEQAEIDRSGPNWGMILVWGASVLFWIAVIGWLCAAFSR